MRMDARGTRLAVVAMVLVYAVVMKTDAVRTRWLVVPMVRVDTGRQISISIHSLVDRRTLADDEMRKPRIKVGIR